MCSRYRGSINAAGQCLLPNGHFGGMFGAATSLALHITGSSTSAMPHILTVITHAGIAFAVGIPVTAAPAAPAIGLHNLASSKAPSLRIPAAALGAVLGPLVAAGLLVGSSPFNAPLPGITWVLFLPAAALAVVYFTHPLGRSKRARATSGE